MHAFKLWKCVSSTLKPVVDVRFVSEINSQILCCFVSPDLLNHRCFKISHTACHREI